MKRVTAEDSAANSVLEGGMPSVANAHTVVWGVEENYDARSEAGNLGSNLDAPPPLSAKSLPHSPTSQDKQVRTKIPLRPHTLFNLSPGLSLAPPSSQHSVSSRELSTQAPTQLLTPKSLSPQNKKKAWRAHTARSTQKGSFLNTRFKKARRLASSYDTAPAGKGCCRKSQPAVGKVYSG